MSGTGGMAGGSDSSVSVVRSLLDGRLEVRTGDITKLDVDAIVNAANSSLLGGGGVDGAIHRAAGPELLAECRRLRTADLPDGLPAGQAVATGGGRLPARYVIHTVGPVWHGGGSGEPGLLASCYRTSLELAASLGGDDPVRTVAFPAISTGVFGYPKDAAGRIAHESIRAFLTGSDRPRQVILIFFSGDDARGFLDAIRDDR